MRQSRIVSAALGLACLLVPALVLGQDQTGTTSTYSLGETVVVGEKAPGPLQEEKSQPATETSLDQDAIRTFGGPGQTNPYKALNLLPSVNAEGTDPYGLTQDQNNLRIRGQAGLTYNRLSRTINGLPLGVNVGNGSMGNFLDMENVSNLSLGRGPIAADKGFGFGNSAGAVDMEILAPADKLGVNLSQHYGSFGFTRTFGRFDLGELPNVGTRFFGSASYSQDDKWRGTGGTQRTNLMAGLAQPMCYGHVRLEAYGLYNQYRQDEFRPLTYDQSKNLGNYRGFDFNSGRTGVPTADFGYYGYNWQHADEWAVFGKLEADLWSGAKATFKPYYAGDSGERYFTNITTTPTANALNVNRTNFQEGQFGFVAEIEQKFDPFKFKAGFWHQDITVYPPPVAGQTAYQITSTGYVFKAWNMLNEVGERIFNAPYVQANGDFGKFHATGGLKYLSANMPWVKSFSTKGVPDVSYDDAFGYSAGQLPARNTNSAEKTAWLPNFGLSYDLTDTLTLRAMYGRNYAYPLQGPLYSVYANNQAAFTAKGITLQHLWNETKLETSDNIDVGARYNNGTFSVAPTLFYAYFHDKQVSAYDPAIGSSYLQSGSEARSYGAELETSWRARPWLTLFGAASYNSFQFTKNIRTALNSSLDVTGNQVPDVPQWMAKLGATVTYEKFTGTVLYRYIDSRYGDAQNNEYVRPYNIVDLNLSYDLPPIFHNNECKLTLDILNLFDERYIAIIRAPSDDTQSGSASYYPGAPLTVVGGITVKF